MINRIKRKYHGNKLYRDKVISIIKQRYHGRPHYKEKIITRSVKTKADKKKRQTNVVNVITNFRNKLSVGPDCVCAVCLKLLFKNQVLKCNRDRYRHSEFISEKYIHKCNNECVTGDCSLSGSRSCLWICYTCQRKLIKNIIPAEASQNNLTLIEIPPEL